MTVKTQGVTVEDRGVVIRPGDFEVSSVYMYKGTCTESVYSFFVPKFLKTKIHLWFITYKVKTCNTGITNLTSKTPTTS